MVSWDKRNRASIDDYAWDIQQIWPRDLERPVLYQWLGVVAHATALIEEVRKGAWGDVAVELAEVFVWWLSFISRLNQSPNIEICERSDLSLSDTIFFLNCSVSDVVWSKFPNVCPVCFGHDLLVREKGEETAKRMIVEETKGEFDKIGEDENISTLYETLKNKPCACLARKQLVEKRQESYKDWVRDIIFKLAEMKKDDKPKSLKDLEDSFVRVFEPNITVLSVDEIAFHLLEEVGEVSRALRDLHLQPHGSEDEFLEDHKQRREAVREELADVFSWIITMRAKSHKILMCAADFSGKRSTEKYARDTVKRYLEPASTLVALVWNVYAPHAPDQYIELKCEVCETRPCDHEHEKHISDRGALFGDCVKPFFNQIKGLELGF